MKKNIVTIAILALSISTNAQNWWSSKKIKGNGKMLTETRTTKDYDQINIGGSFDVILVKGKEGSITLQGEENLLEYIETKVSGDKLTVKVKEHFSIKTTKKLTATITVEEIDGIGLGGSGTIKSDFELNSNKFSISLGGSGIISLWLNAKNISTSIGGSGEVILKGAANKLTCSIGGSGDVNAYDLKTNILKTSIAGSGDIKVTVNDEIKASMVGSGNIYYKGNPSKISSNAIGSGNVIDKN